MFKPYVITAPQWETTSGGVRVMYGLYGYLLAKGQVAFLNQKPTSGDFIAIYPEIELGNPAGASTVVRYILNKPGVVPALLADGTLRQGPTEFDPNDRLYYFSRLFGDAFEKNYMFLPILSHQLFHDQKKKTRDKTAYFVGKGIKDPTIQSQFIHPDQAILIDRELAQDQQGLADLLNECEVMYCYDPVTAMTEIARLCGCRVVMINSVYSKDQFRHYEPGMNGISWGKDDKVPLNTRGFARHYQTMKRIFSAKLDVFIKDTQTQ